MVQGLIIVREKLDSVRSSGHGERITSFAAQVDLPYKLIGDLEFMCGCFSKLRAILDRWRSYFEDRDESLFGEIDDLKEFNGFLSHLIHSDWIEKRNRIHLMPLE